MKKAYLSSQDTGAPLSGAFEVNGLVFVSGQIHKNEKGEVAGSTTEEKLQLTMTCIKKVLGETGLTLDDVIRVNIYLTNIEELADLNKAYNQYFRHPLPARTAIAVSALPLGATLEMDVIALRNDS